MKVLFVQNIEGIAGSEKYFLQLLPSLKSNDVDVHFLAVHKNQFKNVATHFCQELQSLKIPTHQISCKSYTNIGLIRKMKKLILQNEFNIVHSHLIYADFWSVILKKVFRMKFVSVSTLHGYQENIYTEFCLKPEQIPHNKYYRIAKFTYKRIDFVYSCSDGLKNYYLKAGIKFKHPVSVIHHGFDYPETDIKIQRNESEFLCVIPGRLIPRKGHMFVLNQCNYIKLNIPNFKLKIVGDGELKSTLENFTQKNNLYDFVEFTGNVPDVRPYLYSSDLVLVPSYSEGLPLVIFEAMSVSKPVIAFNTIGPAEVVQDGKTGFLITPFDEVKFAEKIIELARNKTINSDMGNQAKKILNEKFSLKIMTEKTIKFYQTVL